MKVLLLGASGLLGHNVLLRLLSEGYEVRVAVRRAGAVRLDKGEWETVVGELTDRAFLLSAAEGCDAIINCAGVTDMGILHLSGFTPINTELPRVLVQEVMPSNGIKTLVQVSTVNTIGPGGNGKCSAEEAPMAAPFTKSLYAISKQGGEQAVLNAARQHKDDWHVVVVNPGFMLGPWDVKPSSGQLLLAGYKRPLMFAPGGGKSFVHVGDVAQAVVAALVRGESGSRYIAVNSKGSMCLKELYRLQAEVMGYGQKIVVLPNWLMLSAGVVGNVLRALGIKTQLSVNNVRQLMVREYYDSSRAVAELGMPETPIRQAIKDFYDWNPKYK